MEWMWVKKVFKIFLDVVEMHFAAILLFLLFLSMVIQVVMRYVFDYPSPALYEIMTWSFVWTVWISAALAWRYNDHIKFNIIYEKLPRKVQLIIDISFNAIFSFTLGISFFPVLNQVIWYKIIRSQVLGIPWDYLLMVLPISMALILFHNALWIYYEFDELIRGKKHKMEDKPWV